MQGNVFVGFNNLLTFNILVIQGFPIIVGMSTQKCNPYISVSKHIRSSISESKLISIQMLSEISPNLQGFSFNRQYDVISACKHLTESINDLNIDNY